MNPLLQKMTTPEQNPFARFVSALVAGASWLSVLSLWASAASVYVNPAYFKWLGILGLAFPLFLAGTVAMLFVSLLFAPRRCWISLLGLLACMGSIRTYVPFNPFRSAITPDSTDLRVVSYNTHFFNHDNDRSFEGISQYLRDLNADVICFQEGLRDSANNAKIQALFSQTRTPYYDYYDAGGASLGLISAYPLLRREALSLFEGNGVVAYWLQLPEGDTLLVLNAHLRSNLLTPDERKEYSTLVHDHQAREEDAVVHTSTRLASKIASSAHIRAAMADTMAIFLAQHPDMPTIVCGDFNETPISYSRYRMVRSGLTDAFRTAANGIGRSFNRDAIWVRIDHTFCSSHFEVLNSRIDREANHSDHYPIISTFRRKRP